MVRAKNSNKRGLGSHNGKNPPRKGKFQGGKWLLTGFALTAIALVSAGAGSLLAMYSTPLGQSKLTPEQAAVFGQEKAVSYKNLNIPQLSRPINVLVLGTKVLTSEEPDPSRPNPGYHALVNSVEGLTDTMVLIRLDPEEKSLVVLSIPRDTRVEIPGYSGARKINQANALGGPALAAMTVTNLLGDVSIDRYIRVNVQAVEKLIDALGGVDVYVPRDMKYQDDSQRLYINLKEGQQRLDGEKALQMLRFRHDALGDIGRIQRQQIVMRAVVEQALKPQTILRIPDIAKILQSNIDTNLNMEELVAIAGFAAQIPREDVKMLMLPGDFNGTGRTSISYWLPHQRKIQEMTEEYFGAMASSSWLWDMEMEEDSINLDPYALRIAIQDSTDRPQAVNALVKELETAGYSRINVVSALSQPLQTTRVIAQQGDHLGARQVRNSIGLGEVLVDSNGYLISDVTIQIGADWP